VAVDEMLFCLTCPVKDVVWLEGTPPGVQLIDAPAGMANQNTSAVFA